MKIIHTSDLHLGSKLTANLDATKSKQRKSEILTNFERLLSSANEQGAELVIIAGDLFDTENITKHVSSEVISALLKHSNIKVIYCVGNHESTAFIDNNDNLPENFVCISKTEWQTFKFGDVTVTGANLTGNNNTLLYNTLMLDSADKNIVILHGEIAKHKSSMPGEKINLPELRDKNIDYLALGHYHFYEKGSIDDRGIYVYSGCLEGRGFDEIDQKGYVLIDTDDISNPQFVPFSKRNLYEVIIDISDCATWIDIKGKVIAGISNISSKDLIKVVLTGKYNLKNETVIYAEELEDQLNAKFYFAKVYDKTEVLLTESDLEGAIGLKAEFLRKINSDETLSDHDKSDILQLGLKALKGEEL